MKNILTTLILCLSVHFIYAQNQVDYDWSQVKIGGGGYITGIQIHPNNKNVAYFRTDVGGAYRWDKDKKKLVQMLNYAYAKKNYYGVAGMALHPTKENIIYLAVDRGNTAQTSKILYSEDYGTNWREINVTGGIKFGANGGREGDKDSKDKDREGNPISINPNNTDELWVGTREKGLWVLDLTAAQKWRKISGIPDNTKEASIRNVVFHPQNANYIYVGYAQFGVYRSTNGGASFQLINNGNNDLKEVADLSLSKNGTKLYVAARRKGIYRLTSPKNALVWEKLNIPPVITSKGYQTVTTSPHNDDLVVAAPTIKNGNNLKNLQVSKNGGTNWTKKSNTDVETTFKWRSASSAGTYVSQLAFDPEDPNKLYLSCWFGLWHTDNWDASQVKWRNDRSKGHEEIVVSGLNTFPANANKNTLIVNSADSPAVVVKNTDSYDNADIHNLIDDKTYVKKGQDIAICETKPNNYTISATSEWKTEPDKPSYGAIFYTTNGGKNYIKVKGYNKEWGKALIATSVNSPENIVAVHGNMIHYSNDRGASFIAANHPTLSTVVENDIFKIHDPLAGDLVLNKVFYLYDRSNGHVIRSENGGKDWRKTASNLPTDSVSNTRASLKAVPGKAGHLWFNHPTEGLSFSSNKGETWTRISSVKKAKIMAFGKAIKANAYPTIYMIGQLDENSPEGLFRSTNRGATWTKISETSSQFLLATPRYMAADRNEFGKVYVGLSGMGVWQGAVKASDNSFIEVTSPILGETITNSNTYKIKWTTNMTGNVRIALWKGGKYVSEIEASVPNNGSYTWSVPSDLIAANDYKIRVRSFENPDIYDYSAAFTIAIPAPECDLIPNGTFQNGDLSGWTFKKSAGASGTYTSPWNKAQLSITNPGTQIWHLRLEHDPITLKGGRTYQLNYSAKAWGKRNMSVFVQDTNGNSLYKTVIPLDNVWKPIPTAQFTMPKDGDVLISFRLGTNNNTVILDTITLDEKGCENLKGKLLSQETSSELIALSLYPNPTKKYIQIDAGERSNDITELIIYNLHGVKLKSIDLQNKLEENKSTSTIDVSKLPSGIYICKIHGTNWQTSKLFVVDK